jgi:carbon-monoxide dehydrogenase large subunit
MSGLGGPGLNATAFYYPETVTWSGGVHIAVVELDRETGLITILKYVVVHDSGIQLNPMIVDGQVHGGLLQGLGAALSEEVTYGEAGQVLSGSLMEYAIPRATDAAPLELESMCFPTQRNPLGIRAVGESGPISPPAAIAAAVEDALGGDVRLTTLPVTPFRIFTANRASENR